MNSKCHVFLFSAKERKLNALKETNNLMDFIYKNYWCAIIDNEVFYLHENWNPCHFVWRNQRYGAIWMQDDVKLSAKAFCANLQCKSAFVSRVLTHPVFTPSDEVVCRQHVFLRDSEVGPLTLKNREKGTLKKHAKRQHRRLRRISGFGYKRFKRASKKTHAVKPL